MTGTTSWRPLTPVVELAVVFGDPERKGGLYVKPGRRGGQVLLGLCQSSSGKSRYDSDLRWVTCPTRHFSNASTLLLSA